MHRWGLVLGLLVAASACGHRTPEEVQLTTIPVRVEVTNNYALAMEIFAVGSGITHRLGTVHPGMSGTFVLPQNLIAAGAVEFQAHTTASMQRFASGELLLSPGAIVDFQIAPVLFSSSATIRP